MNFNSRPSARGDGSSVNDGWTIKLFQFTPLREGRLAPRSAISRRTRYFNSRPSARGDARLMQSITLSLISIHAPPRGATPRCSALYAAGLHFNSRPSARGDDMHFREADAEVVFQFTPLREGRHYTLSPTSRSILFQFTPLREGRLCQDLFNYPEILFQFTPLREGRPELRRLWLSKQLHFNSRPSARGDGKLGEEN